MLLGSYMIKLIKYLLLSIFLFQSCQSVDVEESKALPVTPEPITPVPIIQEEIEAKVTPALSLLEKANLYQKSFLEEPFKGELLLRENDKGKYEGKLKLDKFNGKGILTWAENEVYKGDFKSGFMEGNGSFQKPFSFNQDSTMRNFVIDGKIKSN